MWKTILLTGTGGFIGSVARYFVSRLNLLVPFWSIPLGTLLVNITGSFAIGLLTGVAERSPLLTHEWRLFLMVGVCGGFTTFSTFSNENLSLMHNGQYIQVMLYPGLSILLGFGAVYLGYTLAKIL
jgi:CrcB protein